MFRTRGNAHAHLVLRGGGGRANYDAVSIAVAERELAAADCRPPWWWTAATAIPTRTPACSRWCGDCIAQIVDGNRSIVGLILESHLKAGSQSIPKI